MDLKLGHDSRDGIEVIDVEGTIDISTAPRLRELLIDLVSTDNCQLIVNLERVEFPDSSGIPLWIGSWGSRVGLRRVACLGDGWVASAYNTTPEGFAAAMTVLGGELVRHQRLPGDFPNALVTMWAWITGSRSDAERIVSGVVAPLVGRDPAELGGRICVGSAGECAELLSRYARTGC